MNLNIVQIGGNLVRDIETKFLPSGTAIADFSIAVNRVWYDDQKNKKEETTFVGCTAFGKLAENIAKYFAKGMPIYVSGRLKQEQWEDKEGKKQSKTRVVVDEFQFIGGSKTPSAPDASERQPKRVPRPPADPDLDGEPDVPF